MPIEPPLPRRVSRRVLLTAGGPALLAACVGCGSATSGGTTSAVPSASTSGASASSSATGSTTSSATSSAATSSSRSTASPSSSSSAPSPSTPERTSSSAESTTAATTSRVPPSTAAPTPTAEPTPAGTVVAAVADIPADGGLIVSSPQGDLILALDGGTVVAHSATCTHQGAIIAGDGLCPRHGSLFDVVTGAVLNGPAQSPLAAVTVAVAGGQVYAA